ncbi:hypothetical protein FGADI_6525 [Fusarium gaditjirri]|uniref:Uncharacterized protein n=1 Tax=Fusarium gaditjirri TaxID=282569 RepID=A0A8H4WWC0_9HYPO|nr:hypothetical protein FGADI_6525 [Fusarium gaditjirri]
MAASVQSNVVGYDTFEKLVASQNGGPLPDLHSFYKYVVAQPQGPADLAALATTTATQADPTFKAAAPAPEALEGIEGFNESTYATGSVINLWVYQRVYINALGRSCTIDMGGITPGFPSGALFGTLLYDNESDLHGGCDVAFTGYGPYFALYFRRNGGTFAAYQSGNVGWASGVAGGRGDWA